MPTSNNWFILDTIKYTTTNTTNFKPIELKVDIWYKDNKKPKDIGEFLKRVVIDKSIQLRYFYV